MTSESEDCSSTAERTSFSNLRERFHDAISPGSKPFELYKLFQRCADTKWINSPFDEQGRTILMSAVAGGEDFVQHVMILIERGRANVNYTDKQGRSALQIAMKENCLKMIWVLISFRADALLVERGARFLQIQNKVFRQPLALLQDKEQSSVPFIVSDIIRFIMSSDELPRLTVATMVMIDHNKISFINDGEYRVAPEDTHFDVGAMFSGKEQNVQKQFAFSLLLGFFGSLPVPLITPSVYWDMLTCSDNIAHAMTKLAQLPRSNLEILRALFSFLKHLLEANQEINVKIVQEVCVALFQRKEFPKDNILLIIRKMIIENLLEEEAFSKINAAQLRRSSYRRRSTLATKQARRSRDKKSTSHEEKPLPTFHDEEEPGITSAQKNTQIQVFDRQGFLVGYFYVNKKQSILTLFEEVHRMCPGLSVFHLFKVSASKRKRNRPAKLTVRSEIPSKDKDKTIREIFQYRRCYIMVYSPQ